jgi:two-component system sensor histidine kinase/response regulator
MSQVAFLAQYKGLNIVRKIAPDLPTFQGDEAKLSRVLTNLLDNAIRFTPAGGTLTISVRYPALSADLPDSLQFSVQDTGPGIPRKAFTRIFEKFGRAGDVEGKEKSSSGLGLTFCRMIVEAHEGKIWVESELEQGSTFHFLMPLRSTL